MTIRCWLGLHDWERIQYYHRPDWHDLREYGGYFHRCATCHMPSSAAWRRPRKWRTGVKIETGGHW